MPKTSKQPSLWFGSNAGKRWTEALFLAYSPFWIAWALCVVVPLQLYEVQSCSKRHCSF